MGKSLSDLIGERKLAGVAGSHSLAKDDVKRLPTGIFPVDFTFAGGFPVNIISQIYGPPNGGKTTMAFKTADALRYTCMNCLRPTVFCRCENPKHGKKTCWVTTEGLIDMDWPVILGYDPQTHLVPAYPEYGEQACDMIETFVQADDVGLLVIDSIAGIIPASEIGRPYSDMSIGEQARLLARLAPRLNLVLIQELRRGHHVVVLGLNQRRSKIAKGSFGGTETSPGGNAFQHYTRLKGRCSQVSADGQFDDSGNKKFARFSISLQGSESKQQCKLLAGKAQYDVQTLSSSTHRAGEVKDFPTFLGYAETYGALVKERDHYTLAGRVFNKKAEIKPFMDANPDWALGFKWFVVQKAKLHRFGASNVEV